MLTAIHIAELLNNDWVYWSLMTVYVLTILSVIVIVVSENRNPVKSLAWVTVLLVVPMVGLVLYIVFGRNIQSKHRLSRRNRRILRRLGTQSTPNGERLAQLSDSSKQIVRMANTLLATAFYTGNTIKAYTSGREKFDDLLSDLASARSYINLQYYIIENDKIGRAVQQILIERAKAGVKVRVIYDHVGSFRTPGKFFKELTGAGVEVFPFFKVVFPPFGSQINWRNHRKLCVIDGRVGYIGGMNIADRYIEGEGNRPWRDTHLRITGNAVSALLRSFAVDWTFMGHDLLTDQAVPDPQATDELGMQLITSGPTSQWSNIALVFLKAISTARKRVFIQTPYFLPTPSLLEALQTAALSGVDVRVMIPKRTDSALLGYASSSYIAECLRAGIKIYFYLPGMLHSKVLIIDDEISSVGSTNFDFRSFEHNFEGNMMIYSKPFNESMRKQFADDLSQCQRVTPQQWSHRHIFDRAMSSFMRLFSPIL